MCLCLKEQRRRFIRNVLREENPVDCEVGWLAGWQAGSATHAEEDVVLSYPAHRCLQGYNEMLKIQTGSEASDCLSNT